MNNLKITDFLPISSSRNHITIREKLLKEFPGRRFGHLTVNKVVGMRGREIYWECLCDCGKIRYTTAGSLKRGHISSCGCQITSRNYFRDLVGKKYGKVTVLEKIKYVRGRGVLWNCVCECGNNIEVSSAMLNYKKELSCGCFKYKYDYKKPPRSINSMFLMYKNVCKTRKREFNLSKEQFKTLIMGDCYYCGKKIQKIKPFKNSFGWEDTTYNGIDRVDNKLGYIVNNCVTCCEFCNKMKLTKSKDEFKHHILLLAERINAGHF